MPRPLREISISVTDRCNCRCLMCRIWDKPEKHDLDLDLLNKLPQGLRSVTLTGGEPFLREDLALAVRNVKKKCPSARVVITTNGILADAIELRIKEIIKADPRIAIRVSLDGIGDMHGHIRGISGAYAKVMDTLEVLKGAGVKDLDIHITLTNENVFHLWSVYELSRDLKVKFNCQLAHGSDFYFASKNEPVKDLPVLRKGLDWIIQSELRSFDANRIFKAYYFKGVWAHALGKRREYPCLAAGISCYLDSQGLVYPCIMLDQPIGSLREFDFNELWSGPAIKKAREKVSDCRKNCWLVCTAAPAIKQRPLKALMWVLPNKLKAHLGLKKHLMPNG